MKRIATLLLLFFCTTASAQIYKRIGPDGQVYFSDQPAPGAERVQLPPPQVISMPPVPEPRGTAHQPVGGTTDQQEDSPASYTEFSIVSPANDEGYRANDGNVTVRLSLAPALRSGHAVTLNIDGEDGEKIRAGEGMEIELRNLSRGRHTLKATVVDQEGNRLIETQSVSFNVLRVGGGG